MHAICDVCLLQRGLWDRLDVSSKDGRVRVCCWCGTLTSAGHGLRGGDGLECRSEHYHRHRLTVARMSAPVDTLPPRWRGPERDGVLFRMLSTPTDHGVWTAGALGSIFDYWEA